MVLHRSGLVAGIGGITLMLLLWSPSPIRAAPIFTGFPLQGCAFNYTHDAVADVYLTLNGSQAIFKVPQRPGEPIDNSSALYFHWTAVREQGRRAGRCAPTTNDIIYSMPLSQCQCTINRVNTSTDGVLRIGQEIVMHDCPFPQSAMVAKARFTYTNVTVVEEFNQTLPDSIETSFNYTSHANRWKFSISIENWTWNTTAVDKYPNNTYLASETYLGFETSRPFALELYNDTRSTSIKTAFGAVTVDFTVDLGMILDGQASLSSWFMDPSRITLPQGTGLFALYLPIHFCQPTPNASIILHKWNSVFNDPSISAIFTDFGSPYSPSSNKDRTTTIIVAVVVSAVVAIIIILIILLVLYNDAVRNFFMPLNSKRVAEARKSSALSKDKHSSWQPAAKPLAS